VTASIIVMEIGEQQLQGGWPSRAKSNVDGTRSPQLK